MLALLRLSSRSLKQPRLVVVSPYLFCPGGALPVGFVDTVGTPLAFPFGVFPPPLTLVSVILANATPPKDIDSANITAAINNVMRFFIFSPPLRSRQHENRPTSFTEIAGCATGSPVPFSAHLQGSGLL